MNGIISIEVKTRRISYSLELAKFNHPTHQIAFCTEGALKCITFKEAIHV